MHAYISVHKFGVLQLDVLIFAWLSLHVCFHTEMEESGSPGSWLQQVILGTYLPLERVLELEPGLHWRGLACS